MSSFRIRPRFQREMSESPEGIRELFRQALEREDAPCTGRFSYDNIILYIPEEEQHYWSPQLSMYLEENEFEGGTTVYGTYGPRPSVWAAFFYGYAVVVLLALGVAIWGCSLWMLEKEVTILWGLPVVGGIGLLLYLVAQGGQKIGAEQTFTLHHFFEDTVGKRTHIH